MKFGRADTPRGGGSGSLRTWRTPGTGWAWPPRSRSPSPLRMEESRGAKPPPALLPGDATLPPGSLGSARHPPEPPQFQALSSSDVPWALSLFLCRRPEPRSSPGSPARAPPAPPPPPAAPAPRSALAGRSRRPGRLPYLPSPRRRPSGRRWGRRPAHSGGPCPGAPGPHPSPGWWRSREKTRLRPRDAAPARHRQAPLRRPAARRRAGAPLAPPRAGT